MGIVLVGALCWMLWGVLSSHVEHAEYSVIAKTPDYELRQYPRHIVAQTTVAGSYRAALNQGFRILATYIFGDNAAKETIEMTAPVREQKK